MTSSNPASIPSSSQLDYIIDDDDMDNFSEAAVTKHLTALLSKSNYSHRSKLAVLIEYLYGFKEHSFAIASAFSKLFRKQTSASAALSLFTLIYELIESTTKNDPLTFKNHFHKYLPNFASHMVENCNLTETRDVQQAARFVSKWKLFYGEAFALRVAKKFEVLPSDLLQSFRDEFNRRVTVSSGDDYIICIYISTFQTLSNLLRASKKSHVILILNARCVNILVVLETKKAQKSSSINNSSESSRRASPDLVDLHDGSKTGGTYVIGLQNIFFKHCLTFSYYL
jgi:hypothetical protein